MYALCLFLSLFCAIFGAVAVLYLLYNGIMDKISLFIFRKGIINGRWLFSSKRRS
jgi:hypothetical protein